MSAATFESSISSPFSLIDSPSVVKETAKKEITARQQKCFELQHTERNYVHILQTIVKVDLPKLTKLEDFNYSLLFILGNSIKLRPRFLWGSEK